MKIITGRFRLVAVIGIFLAVMLAGSVQKQEADLFEPFDNPTLPGWERSPGAVVTDGILRVEPGNFAALPGGWGEMEIHVIMKLEGEGEVFFTYRTGDGSGYRLVFGTDYLLFFRELEGTSTILHSTEPLPAPLGDWFHLTILSTAENQLVLIHDEEIFKTLEIETLPPGGIGFEAHGEMSLEVDELAILSLGEAPPSEEGQPPEEETQPEEESPAEEPASLPTGELTWVRLGGPPGGLGYDIRYDFDDPNIWYVTDANAGVHISRDNGLTWHQSNTGINAIGGPSGDGIPVFCLTIDPHNHDIIWIGTTSGEIYKSIDRGATWVQKDKGVILDPNYIIKFRGFTVDPRTSDIVYAMAEVLGEQSQDPFLSNTGGAVYRTKDGGENWTLIWDGAIPASLARYMWIDPRDPDVLFVSTGIFDSTAVGDTDPETSQDPLGGLGILKSVDGGQSWQYLDKDNGLDFLYIGSLFMDPEDPDILLAAAGRLVPDPAFLYMHQQGHSPLGIYRTTDGGETWTQVLEGEGNLLVQTFSAVEICPSDPEIAYAASEYVVYRSEDGGQTWMHQSGGESGWGPAGVKAGNPIDLQCDPRNPDRLFANNYQGGNFLSEDGGITWINASSGYSGAQVIGLAVDPMDPARVFAAGRSGAWYSEDGGLTWNGIHNPGETASVAGVECGSVAVDPEKSEHVVFACLIGFLVFDSAEQQWIHIVGPPDYHPGTSEIEFALSDPQIIIAASASHNTMIHAEVYEDGKGIVMSVDGGFTWQTITGDQFQETILTDVAIDPRNEKVIYVAAENGLYKSVDGGVSWTSPSSSLAGLPVRTVAVSPSDSNWVLAGVQSRGIFLSKDGGTSWVQQPSGLEPNSIPRDIVFDPNNPDTVYAADILSGVYRSTDGGQIWEKISNGLSNRSVITMALSSDGLHLYAGTSGGGVFRLDFNGQPPTSPAAAEDSSSDQFVEDGEEEMDSEMVHEAGTDLPRQAFWSLTTILLAAGGVVLLLVGAIIISRRVR